MFSRDCNQVPCLVVVGQETCCECGCGVDCKYSNLVTSHSLFSINARDGHTRELPPSCYRKRTIRRSSPHAPDKRNIPYCTIQSMTHKEQAFIYLCLLALLMLFLHDDVVYHLMRIGCGDRELSHKYPAIVASSAPCFALRNTQKPTSGAFNSSHSIDSKREKYSRLRGSPPSASRIKSNLILFCLAPLDCRKGARPTGLNEKYSGTETKSKVSSSNSHHPSDISLLQKIVQQFPIIHPRHSLTTTLFTVQLQLNNY